MPFFLSQILRSSGNNFGQVSPFIYRSAELPAAKLQVIARYLHIEQMVNLRDDLPGEERREIADAGLRLVWMPMADDKPPYPTTIPNVIELLRNTTEVTLVCCKGGRHRTGLVIACYRVEVDGWTKTRAWNEAEHFGWYDTFGHKPLRLWFENDFQPSHAPAV